MINAAFALKEALSKKASTMAQISSLSSSQVSPNTMDSATPPVCVSLNLHLDARRADSLVQCLQALIRLVSPQVQLETASPNAETTRIGFVPSQAASQAAPTQPASSRPKCAIAAAAVSPVPANHKVSAAAPAAMTAKQRKMIFALTAKKALSAEQVEEILLELVGHSRSADLTSREASRFISHLLSL